MPQPFGTHVDIKLIKLVKENPVLYNTKHPKYSDSDTRELAWQKISDAIGKPTQRCKSRWLNIRDMLRRTIRLRIQYPNEYHRKYRYEEDLAFMVPHFKLSKTSQDLEEYLDESTGVQMPMPVEYNQDLEFDELSIACPKRIDNAPNPNRSEVEAVSQELNPTDPLDVFLMAIGCSMKKFNPYYLNQAKSKIFQICQEYELQQITDRPSTAAEFAGIQCHIQFGDYHEQKHKPGFIENLHEYLPEPYCSVRGIEKKILKEYSSHVGLTELEAKHLYTKTARELPTYGVTFFLVKEKQKSKNKLVPRLLGINSEAILRLDECTKEILQQWPLTHVKTYHAGKGETFTLNFGDYVDKEYSVKTRDAFRIQDILEGYIDLIRKQMLANYNRSQSEVCYVGQDTVGTGQASMVQHVSNSPMKIVEQTFVGPSTIVEYEPGQKACHGTQMITVQQMVTSELINKQGQGVKGEVPLRKDMGIPFARRLNRLNSNSVKVVTLLTEPLQGNLEGAKKIVDAMNAEMPSVREGVKQTVANQTDEEEQRKLQEQLHQLDELMKLLSDTTRPGSENPTEAEDTAKHVADLTTEMYFAIDPKTRRRSRILSKTRDSFIADDRMEKNLRRASFIAATATANHAIDNAEDLLKVDYLGPAVDPSQVERLEKSAVDKLGKLNAAIAHYLLAHSDPQNIDYGAAVNSLNTIHELMPELAKDGQALASTKDGKDRKELLADIKDLCAAAKHVCSLSGAEDAEKQQEASARYANVAGKLIFTFGKGMRARAEKENEVVGLAKEAGVKASELLMSAQGLTEMAASEPGAVLVDEAGVKTAAAAKDLISQAEINAPTIQEPHCQSALTAAAEGLSSSAQHLAAAWKPLVEDPSRHEIGEKLHNRTMDLAKALDRLKDSYSNLEDGADTSGGELDGGAQRLKFINSLNRVKGGMQAAEDDLNKPVAGQVPAAEAQEARRRLAERLARLNAAIAGLLAATGDGENPDYATAELAVATINELMPELVKDSKIAAANQDEASRAALLDEIRALCAGSRDICASAYGAEPQDLSAAVGKFTDAAGKLTYVVNKRANPDKEAVILDQTKAACSQAGVLLSGVQQLSVAVGGDKGGELDARGAELADTAQALLTAAQVTAPSISDPRCQSVLLGSADKVTASGRRLQKAWEPLEKDPQHEDPLRALKRALNQLDNQLDQLRATCQEPDLETQSTQESVVEEPLSIQGSEPQEHQKLQFIKSMNGARGKLENARKELNKPAMPAKGADSAAVAGRLAQHLGQLNAAIAALLAATADREKPDYAAAEKAANTISDLMPRVIQDTKTVSAGKDEPTRVAMLAQVKGLCDASEGICVGVGASNTQGLNEAVAKLSDASGKLVYVVSPRANAQKEHEIVSLSGGACQQTSALLSGVQRLAEVVGGAQGQDLDAQGGRVADAAQGLLQAAQITAPSMSSPQCQAALLSSVDHLSSAGHQMVASLAPLHNDPKHNQQVHELNRALQQLEAQLESLRKACKAPEGDFQDPIQKQQKLQFTRTMQGAKERLGDAQKELKKPAMPAKGSDMDAVQVRLSHGLGQLNAAIAALLAATADREKPNYAAAEKAASTIADLMPHIVKDTKTVSAGKDEPTRDAMLAQVKELCDASEGICVGVGANNTQGLNDAVAQFSDASGKLVYVVSPRANAQKEHEIVSLSGGACQQTSALLSGVQRLVEAVGDAKGQDLDAQGGRVADAAQGLLQAAQITAPSMSSPQCQAALLSSVDHLSSAGHQMAASLAPLHNDPKHNQQVHELNRALQQLEAQLEALRKACKAPAGDSQDPIQKQQKLQFTRTMQGAKERLGDAQKELKKPATPAKGSDMDAVQVRLSHGLGQLNAAIAALLAATADREKPNYAAAEKAASTIADLMPHIVKDTKTVSAGKDEPTRDAMLAQVKELCDASEGICVGVGANNTQGLNDAVAKFSDASGKLVYVVSPRANAQKEQEIVSLSGGACQQTSALLSGVQRLAEAVGAAQGQDLDAQGGRVADAAQGLLQAAQITAPSMSSPQSQAALLSSVDHLSSAGHQMVASLAPLHNDPKHNQQVHELNRALQQLEAQLEALRKACKAPAGDLQDPIQKQQKLQFTRTMQGAKERLGDAQKELKKPATPAKGSDMDAVQVRLSHGLGQLNAAIAALLAATADREKPNYAAAEKAASTIADLMPHIVKDTKTVSAGKDEPTRDAMLAQVKELCDASEGICVGVGASNTQGLNDAVAKFSDASGKLVYVVSPRANAQKEQEIVTLSGGACQQTSVLLSGVQRLAEAVGGSQGQDLDAQGGRVADAAQSLLQTAQITAPSMSSPQCQAALLSSVDHLSSAGHQMAASLAPLHNDPKHNQQVHELNRALQQLEAQLNALRNSCCPSEPSPPLPASKPPTHAPGVTAHAAPHGSCSTDFTQDFLNTLRREESMAQSHQPPSSPKVISPSAVDKGSKAKPPPPPRNTEEDKRLQQQFEKVVDEATTSIKEKEANLMKLCKQETGTGPALSQSEMVKKQLRLQQDLAMADVEVARLVAANYADKIDYAEASKSMKSLGNWMKSIVEGGKQLSDNVNDMARKAFLYDMLQLCEANRKLCDAAKSDRQKLNDAAVHFGDASAKLLYVVSSDVDPALEKEIISRAIAIGDSASHLALDAAGIATAPSGNASGSVQDICDAGTACVDAASKVVYTAKLTAPSIHESPCQEALVHSTETLSKKLKSFTDSWKPLVSDPQQASTIKHLSKEADNLERILEGLRSDVRGGSLRKRREVEQLVVEDTPLRRLTVQVLDGAKVYAESADMPATQKIEYASYADKLQSALRALDLANARCKKTPHDTNKRRDLENAIQNLQVILLQSRPTRGDKGKSNIVDLRDFIDEVSSEAKKMSAASDVKVPTAQDKRTLEGIKEKCNAVEVKANKLMNVDSRTDMDSTFDDILEVDQFGLECDNLIKEINADLKGMEDAKTKRLLFSRMLPLSESCNMLRFATKSGISTEASAGLDSSLDDLDRIEAEVIHSIVTDADNYPDRVLVRSKQPSITGHSPATINLCREVADSSSGVNCATVTAYIADAASKTDTTNPEEKNKLLKHLFKLVHLLKTLTITTSVRSATWQPLAGPDVATVTEQILQEIYNPESKFGVKSDAKTTKIIEESELVKLLIPPAPEIMNDPKLQEHKLSELASQVVSTCGALRGGPGAPVAARAALAAVQASIDLNAVARGTATHDAIKYKLVDKAAKEMSFATYNVIKTAESANQEPNNQNLRRRLVDACESLNRAVNKLVSVSSSSPPLSQRCGALSRDVALQLANMQPRPVGAAPFQDTCDQLHQQKDSIYKLKSERAMPRVEFMRDLDDIGAALRRSTECATQCAYYIAISDLNKDIAKTGLIDVPHIQKSIENIQDSCMAIIGCSSIQQAKEEKEDLHKRMLDLSGALDKAQVMVSDGDVKRTLASARSCISDAAGQLEQGLNEGDMVKVTPRAVSLLEAVNRAHGMIEQCLLVPTVGDMAAGTKAKWEDVMDHSKNLLSNTLELLQDVNSSAEESDMLTWATYNTSRRKLLDAYDALLTSVKRNGHGAGILEKAPEEEHKKVVKKSYIETQVDLANKWLKSPACKTEAKSLGQQAVRNVVDVARQMSEDLKGTEREEIRNTINDTEELLGECSKKYEHEKYCALSDRLKELKKAIQRGVVTRVVEDFIEAEAPLADLDVLADSERDELKRKFILERKIASLLAQLGRLTRTARFVAGASQHLEVELTQCSEQAELFAPMLVQAAQQRIDHPDDTVIVEKYKSLLAQYAESVRKVRDLCDRAVDPMEFVQAAGDTMQRMREDMTLHINDPHKCAYSSSAISRLANRVIHVSMSSPAVQEDPEMQKALQAAATRLKAAAPPVPARASRLPDWKESTAEILRTTGDVESALGGENIFKKQPTIANQPIYSGAAALHAAVRGWSARDNDIVAAARRLAVLMARLAGYMDADKQQALITTSKSIVVESQEVAELAKKLAHECSDVRIKTNLLQTCERIPTISGQLKMLTTVKSSSLGHQGSQEDKEAMDMLVVNAQSLMMSIQEVVKAAAGASVKIMSQRGPRIRWVRKDYY